MAAQEFLVDIDVQGNKVKNLGVPTLGTDAATKQYVDSTAQGLKPKASVTAVATANIAALTGTPIIDGYQTLVGDRVLLIGQATASQNGIWIVAGGAWGRPTDFATGMDATGAYVYVEGPAGSQNVGQYAVLGEAPNVIDTAPLTWVRVAGAPAVRKMSQTIGDGVTTSFNINHNLGTTDVVVDVFLIATGESVIADVLRTSVNVVQVSFGSAPAANAYRVVVVG